jgi:hypothetical protein
MRGASRCSKKRRKIYCKRGKVEHVTHAWGEQVLKEKEAEAARQKEHAKRREAQVSRPQTSP